MNNLNIASLYVGINILIVLFLAINVIRHRRGKGIGIGDGGDAEMLRAIRTHGNATEYVPAALIGLVIISLGAQPAWIIHTGGILLTVGRLLHASGLIKSTGVTNGRLIGTSLTLVSLLWIGVCCILGFL
jgi:hypothetical protein